MISYFTFDYWLPKLEKREKNISYEEYHLFIKISFLTQIVSFGYILSFLLFNYAATYLFYILPPFILMSFLSLVCIKLTGRKNISGSIFLASVAIYFYICFVLGGGVRSPSIMWISLFPFIATIMTSNLVGRAWSIFFLGAILSIGFFIYEYGISFHFYSSKSLMIESSINIIILPFVLLFLTKHSYSEIKRLLSINTLLIGQNKNVLSVLVHDTSHLLTKLSFLSHLSSKKEFTTKELTKKIGDIKTTVNILDELISQTRDVVAYESQKKSVSFAWIEATDIYKKIRFVFQERLHEKNLTLSSNIDMSNNFALWTNSSLLINNIINNLLSNAIKFSKNNSEISLDFYNENEHFIITVSDRGVGITAKQLLTLFDDSVVTSSVGTAGEIGTGFGLPIVRKTLKLIYGEIEVKTGKNGTCFILKIENRGVQDDE